MHPDGVTIPEEDWLLLSGLEHFRFCRRQWALIHLEHQWVENAYTVEGNFLHERAHGETAELRGDLLTVRGLRVFSPTLGVTGACDVVEFRRDPAGVSLQGREGLWSPAPVEYKRGAYRADDPAALQLCCQAMCLEEMLCCAIPQGFLYYGETRRRHEVTFSDDLRTEVRTALAEMHDCARRGHTPKVRPTKSCNACSLRELCLPRLGRETSASGYLQAHVREVAP